MRTFLLMVAILAGSDTRADEWRRLAPLPDKEGFAGSFAGVSNGTLIVAGGANFPDRKPWEGGTKVWHKTVFALEIPNGQWKIVGELPRPLGYGISVTHGTGVVCVGGGDGDRHYADAFRLDWREGKLHTVKLPSMPMPIANACGALVGDTLYVAGGQEKPTSNETLKLAWKLDLAAGEPMWKEIEAYPGGGRMLSVAAALDGAFWVVGGADLFIGKDGKPERGYLKDAYRYDSVNGWKRIADLPRPVVAAPSPAPSDAVGFSILGGDDGTQVGTAPDRHTGFSKTVLRYDAKSGKWSEGGELSAPRVTVPCVHWHASWVVPGGEMRPGVRSPEVWSMTARDKE